MRWKQWPVLFAGWIVWTGASAALGVNPSNLENAYWRFEEGAAGAPVAQGDDTVPDSSGNANHMKVAATSAAPLYSNLVPTAIIPQTGAPNTRCLRFDGGQDIFAELKNIDNPIVSAFTLEAAFNADTVGGNYMAIVGKDGQPTTAPEQTLVLKIRGDTGRLQIELFDKGGTRRSVTSLAPIVAAKWHYVVVVADTSTLTLYLDSNDGNGYVLQGSSAVSGGGPLWQGTNPTTGYYTPWVIGRGQYGGGNTDWFRGSIDEVRLTNRALGPSEFLFRQGAIKGDLDKDGDVDAEDVHMFGFCATGPELPYDPQARPAGCVVAPGAWEPDFDEDGDVDQSDYGALQAAYTG